MNRIVAEYIWIDGNGNLRSKARTLNWDKIRTNDGCGFIYKDHEIPLWNYDGSSTEQAAGNNSEVILYPCYAVPCPFRRNKNILIMCEAHKLDGESARNNNRSWAKKLFDKRLDAKPWYGLEQEFFMTDKDAIPLGFNEKSKKQGQYYCSVGTNNAFGRSIIDKHYELCLYAGLSISGVNAEVAPGQWEYQIGPVEGIEAGDQLYLSRYILQRIAEEFDVIINFEPKPLIGDWNGSGCHTNYSTLEMREGTNEKEGLDYINNAIKKLEIKHDDHMKVYGTGNEQRMTGKHETASFDKFTWGVADRGASIRIPRDTEQNGCGYFEDRRPSSNMDPYLVTGIIFKTTVLD